MVGPYTSAPLGTCKEDINDEVPLLAFVTLEHESSIHESSIGQIHGDNCILLLGSCFSVIGAMALCALKASTWSTAGLNDIHMHIYIEHLILYTWHSEL